MASKPPGSGIVVVVELGALWPGWLIDGTPYAARRVQVELEREGPAAFAERVAGVSASLLPRGLGLSLAVLACNERADAAALRARRAIAATLIELMAGPAARLVLTASERPRERLASVLVELSSELQRSVSNGSVSVQFGAERTASSSRAVESTSFAVAEVA